MKIIATRGTAAALTRAGIEVEAVYKVNEGRPNIVDLMKTGKVNLLINTPLGRESFYDEKSIRRAAVRYNVPCITTLSAASAAARGIRAMGLERAPRTASRKSAAALAKGFASTVCIAGIRSAVALNPSGSTAPLCCCRCWSRVYHDCFHGVALYSIPRNPSHDQAFRFLSRGLRSRRRPITRIRPTAAGIDAAAREVQLDPGVRSNVVEVLREQNRRFARAGQIDSATARNLDRLAAGAVAIVTGPAGGTFLRPSLSAFTKLSPPFAAPKKPRVAASMPFRSSGWRPRITISPR